MLRTVANAQDPAQNRDESNLSHVNALSSEVPNSAEMTRFHFQSQPGMYNVMPQLDQQTFSSSDASMDMLIRNYLSSQQQYGPLISTFPTYSPSTIGLRASMVALSPVSKDFTSTSSIDRQKAQKMIHELSPQDPLFNLETTSRDEQIKFNQRLLGCLVSWSVIGKVPEGADVSTLLGCHNTASVTESGDPGLTWRRCTNCRQWGHDRRNCLMPRLDSTGRLVEFQRHCGRCGSTAHDRRTCPHEQTTHGDRDSNESDSPRSRRPRKNRSKKSGGRPDIEGIRHSARSSTVKRRKWEKVDDDDYNGNAVDAKDEDEDEEEDDDDVDDNHEEEEEEEKEMDASNMNYLMEAAHQDMITASEEKKKKKTVPKKRATRPKQARANKASEQTVDATVDADQYLLAEEEEQGAAKSPEMTRKSIHGRVLSKYSKYDIENIELPDPYSRKPKKSPPMISQGSDVQTPEFSLPATNLLLYQEDELCFLPPIICHSCGSITLQEQCEGLLESGIQICWGCHNYEFDCDDCTGVGHAKLTLTSMNWESIVSTTIINLTILSLVRRGDGSIDPLPTFTQADLMDYVSQNWPTLCHGRNRDEDDFTERLLHEAITGDWKANIEKILKKRSRTRNDVVTPIINVDNTYQDSRLFIRTEPESSPGSLEMVVSVMEELDGGSGKSRRASKRKTSESLSRYHLASSNHDLDGLAKPVADIFAEKTHTGVTIEQVIESSIDLMKTTSRPAIRKPRLSDNLEASLQTPTLTGSDVFSVDKIVSKKVSKNGTVMYLVQWAGYKGSDCTWEPRENILTPQLVESFEKGRKRALQG